MAVYRLSVDPSLSCLITSSLFSLRLKFICFTNPSQLRLPHIGLLLKISPTVGLHEAATRTKSRVTRKSAVTATYILIHKIHARLYSRAAEHRRILAGTHISSRWGRSAIMDCDSDWNFQDQRVSLLDLFRYGFMR